MGSGFSKMKKQARMMEEQYHKIREERESTRATGESGNGLVSVVINGNNEVLEVKIKPDCVDPGDLEGLQDLIVAACADAYTKLPGESISVGGMPFSF